MSKSAVKSHSTYWMDEDLFDDDIMPKGKEEANIMRITRLATTRRAIANFVNILTNRNDIPVQFSSGKESYTDGKRVVISADDNPDHFDSTVGLALHEASHVLLSDFTFLEKVNNHKNNVSLRGRDNLWNNTSLNTNEIAFGDTVSRRLFHPALVALLPNTNGVDNYGNFRDNAEVYRYRVDQFVGDLMMLMNIIEDRRIDKYVFQTAGGYRPYYMALYTRYFLTADIEKNLKWNPEWRELTVENYINRLLFSIHPAASPDALPGLRKMIAMMDLANVEKYAPTKPEYEVHASYMSYDQTPMLWKVANEIYAQILKVVALGDMNKPMPQQHVMSIPSEDILKATGELPNLDMDKSQAVAQDVEPAEKTKKGKDMPTKFDSKKGQKAVDAAKKVLQGEVKKKKASKKEIQQVDALEAAQAEMEDISGDGIPKGNQCMVTRKMTEKMLDQDWFIFRRPWQTENPNWLPAGKRMGQLLVHRLQVRNDPVVTKNTRLMSGGLDRRLLAQLGMDITSVFQKSRVDTFKPAMLHLTIDASGSMSGDKWKKVMTIATALAYVGSKMRNIDTVITIRGGNDLPMVCVVFDSRKDQFVHFTRWITKIAPNGATPEGLCFKATMDLVLECKATHDVYFINFSDGEPSFYLNPSRYNYTNYAGDLAIRHTKHQVQTLREHGVKVLSYFITDNYSGKEYTSRAFHNFKAMYGEDAVHVNVEQATAVLTTLNKLLTARGA